MQPFFQWSRNNYVATYDAHIPRKLIRAHFIVFLRPYQVLQLSFIYLAFWFKENASISSSITYIHLKTMQWIARGDEYTYVWISSLELQSDVDHN